MSPNTSTIKKLFALSSNECAFPKCKIPIIDLASSKIIGEICHIKARSEGGPRYDEKQTEAERHSFDNLILLCSMHHSIIDADTVAYTVERLFSMKNEHEENAKRIDELPDGLILSLSQTFSETNIKSQSFIDLKNSSGTNQIIGKIENFHLNDLRERSGKITVNFILNKTLEKELPLSACLAKVFELRGEFPELMSFAKKEIMGYGKGSHNEYRHVNAFASIYKINQVRYNQDEYFDLFKDMERHEDFHKIKFSLTESVSAIEERIIENSNKKPENAYYFQQSSLFDITGKIEDQKILLNIYFRGFAYLEVLNRIREEFVKILLKYV